ncbi:hypothetical protein ACTU44_06235 [Thalassospira sp. SM2505]|uniref:Uncharacterized protein n=1 Tax=Thalassospira profundimaris TaxID=502049 RepID=A0A367WPU8_9PROT|nr:hypothetical protein [Thalassospira profundimaris]RCK43417.1 hypothetical protein TH30_19100 [Thalassospira profundimaris]
MQETMPEILCPFVTDVLTVNNFKPHMAPCRAVTCLRPSKTTAISIRILPAVLDSFDFSAPELMRGSHDCKSFILTYKIDSNHNRDIKNRNFDDFIDINLQLKIPQRTHEKVAEIFDISCLKFKQASPKALFHTTND